jgi:hypothetical protein
MHRRHVACAMHPGPGRRDHSRRMRIRSFTERAKHCGSATVVAAVTGVANWIGALHPSPVTVANGDNTRACQAVWRDAGDQELM